MSLEGELSSLSSQMRKGRNKMLDQAAGEAQNMGKLGVSIGAIKTGAPRAVRGASKVSVSILELLHWAFARECASIDFDELANSADGVVVGVDTIWRLMQNKELGCRVDGGGRSDPHPDADIVASAVAALPEGCGGRKMAVTVAELARIDGRPDWMQNDATKIFPMDTHTNRWGVHAKTEDAARLGENGWPAQPRRNRKGVIVMDKVLFCPVAVRPMPNEIARVRRAYLRWWGALRELRDTFRVYGGLTAFEVALGMPPRTPWEKRY